MMMMMMMMMMMREVMMIKTKITKINIMLSSEDDEAKEEDKDG